MGVTAEVISMENNIPKPVGPAEVMYSGIIFDIIHQNMQIDDKTETYEVARRSPGVRIMFVKNGRMLIAKEYREEISGWDYRLPGGKVFDSLREYKEYIDSGDEIIDYALKAVENEGREEAGLVADNIEYFSKSGSGGRTVNWDLYYFVVEKFHLSDGGQMLEPGENITCEWMGFDDVKRLCLDGSIQEDRTVANVLKFIMKNHK